MSGGFFFCSDGRIAYLEKIFFELEYGFSISLKIQKDRRL